MSEAAQAVAPPPGPAVEAPAEPSAGPSAESPAAASAPRGELMVRFTGVGKAFRRFEQQPFLLRNLLSRLVGKRVAPREFWPLQDVSFEIRRGETVGVIGQNGSGKSTLLRLLAGAAYPTRGHIAVRGRIAPLLSLGAGFQPDMTGRECVEVNGTALGLSREEIAERLGDIIGFAELREFMDTPVRYYSSGMQARLGFSVAVHTDPDLLLVDEVLAVGDHAFQQKCFARIHEIQRRGTTIFFVSHDAATIRDLCDRVLWLRDGHLVRDGEPGPILDEYLRVLG